jgi:hypothetical protein
LAACSPLQTYLKTDTTAFYKDTFTTNGSIVVLAGDINLNNSLEFDLYKQKVEEKLVAEGFSMAADLDSANFAALLLYGVDDGKQSVVYSPIFRQTGRHINAYSDVAYDADGKAVYIRRSYLSPSFVVVGASAKTKTSYRHTIALDIVKADSLSQDKPVKVFEGRTFSSGNCGVIVEVFDELLEAMFVDFPGENGRNRTDSIESITNCP